MEYQTLLHLDGHLAEARNQCPKGIEKFGTLTAVEETLASLDAAIGLLKHHRLVIGDTNVKALLAPTVTSLREYQAVARGKTLKKSERKGILKNARQRIKQANRIVHGRVIALQRKDRNPKTPKVEIPIEQRITSFAELAEVLDRNLQRQKKKEQEEKDQQEIKAANKDLDSVENQLEGFDRLRNKLPKRVRDPIKFETLHLPVLVVPSKPFDFARLSRNNIEYKRLASGIILPNQLVIAWNPRSKHTPRNKQQKTLVDKAIQLISERTGVNYQRAFTERGTEYFTDSSSPLHFAWLIPDKLATAMQVPIKSMGFPFTTSEVVKDIDYGDLRAQLELELEKQYPELMKKLRKTRAEFKIAQEDMSFFDRRGEPNDNWTGKDPNEPEPALYEDYKRDYERVKKRLKTVEDEFKRARSRVVRKMKK